MRSGARNRIAAPPIRTGGAPDRATFGTGRGASLFSHAKAEHEDAVFALADATVAAVRGDIGAAADVNAGGKEDAGKTASSSAL